MNSPAMSAFAEFSEALVRAGQCLGLSLDDRRARIMFAHFERVIETNARFNLTRITEPDMAAVKLYADSLAPLAWLACDGASVSRVLDVGTGAGFPAVPLAVLRPGWRVTAIDSVGKKARFLDECAAGIGLGNLRAIQARAGEWKPPARFDLVLFKAVTVLSRSLPFARGLVARGGQVVFFAGPSLTRSQIDAAEVPARRIGLQIWDTFDYDLPCRDEQLQRTLVIYRRV